MWRPFDVQCPECDRIHERFAHQEVGGERPSIIETECPHCGAVGDMPVVMGLPAPYMGEKVLNPKVYGGPCDTMGAREHMDLPDLPGQEEHNAKLRKAMRALPDNCTKKERDAAWRDAMVGAPSSADYATLFESSEYKSVKRENAQIRKENLQKQQRAAAMKRGESVNMRRDKCAGDPNMTT